MIANHLRLQPGQQALTSEQEAEARHFADARIVAQLSTETVDEPETERLLRNVYAARTGLSSQPIRWVDGPMHLDSALASLRDALLRYESVWDEVLEEVEDSLMDRFRGMVYVSESYQDEVSGPWPIDWEQQVTTEVRGRVRTLVWNRVQTHVWEQVGRSLENGLYASNEIHRDDSVQASVRAYAAAHRLAFYRFFDEYQAPNRLHALAHFSEWVSGYWLGRQAAIIVRRPRKLARDAAGRLHSETGRCVEYGDGWGCYAWHGVLVPENVILEPERLTREDFLQEPSVEVRRVIQERMGERFVSELGGVVLESDPRGTLYEVALPHDPERVARYVQMQDTSTERRYVLRVPPTIQTAAEAVAWTFQVAATDYRPAQET